MGMTREFLDWADFHQAKENVASAVSNLVRVDERETFLDGRAEDVLARLSGLLGEIQVLEVEAEKRREDPQVWPEGHPR